MITTKDKTVHVHKVLSSWGRLYYRLALRVPNTRVTPPLPSCPTNLVSLGTFPSMLIQKANCKSDELNFLLYGPQLGTFSLVLPLSYQDKITRVSRVGTGT